MNKIKFLKTRDVISPSRANQYDAGVDFYIPKFNSEFISDFSDKNPTIAIIPEKIILPPQKRVLIPAGIKCKMANNDRALIAFNKSGVATKFGLTVGAAVVDYLYQGEIHISLINTGTSTVELFPDQKIVQFIETPIYTSIITIVNSEEELFEGKITSRGEGGFGSTDQK